MHPGSGRLVVGVGISPTVREWIAMVGGNNLTVRCEYSIVRGRGGYFRGVLSPLAMGARQGYKRGPGSCIMVPCEQ
jgi:hypothetical protein